MRRTHHLLFAIAFSTLALADARAERFDNGPYTAPPTRTEEELDALPKSCLNRAGQAVACLCPAQTSTAAADACAAAQNSFTGEQRPVFLEIKKQRALKIAIQKVPSYAQENKGFQAGYKYSLTNKVPVDDGAGNYHFTQAQIDAAKTDAQRLAPVFEEKVDDLIAKIKADMKYDKQSKIFQENFDDALKRGYFSAVITPATSGKPEDAVLNVELSDNMLQLALTEATIATVNDPAVMADAEAKLEKAKEKLATTKAALKEKQDKRDEEACRELRAQRDREFSLDGGGTREPAATDVKNNTVIFK